jgi:AcrR family transcriptional regulator
VRYNSEKIKAFEASTREGKGVSDRLVDVVSGMWATHGRAAMSARQVALAADTTTSLINYYFGGFEQLLLSAQARSVVAARIWCEAQSQALAGLPDLNPEATGHLIAALIDDLCVQHRSLVFAWAECQVLAERNAGWLPAANEWRTIWTVFWNGFAEQLGLSGKGDLMRMFFKGEVSMHRIRWHAPLDRAALSETCIAWIRLMRTGRAGPMPLRDHARTRAVLVPSPALLEGTIERTIADAAADLIGSEGAGAITHRAVAKASGTSLGSVTHHFPTSDALISAAFDRIYGRVTQEGADEAQVALPLTGQGYVDMLAQFGATADRSAMLAIDELISAAGRDAGLATFGGVLRYTRGKSSLRTLSRLKSVLGPLGSGEAALYSAWIQGMARDMLCVAPEARPEQVGLWVRQMLDIIGVQD